MKILYSVQNHPSTFVAYVLHEMSRYGPAHSVTILGVCKCRLLAPLIATAMPACNAREWFHRGRRHSPVSEGHTSLTLTSCRSSSQPTLSWSSVDMATDGLPVARIPRSWAYTSCVQMILEIRRCYQAFGPGICVRERKRNEFLLFS